MSNGHVEKANQMLGQNFSIEGEVVKGNQIGRTIGFRTANLIYSVDTNYGKGIANFGVRPTVNGSNAVLEIHILNFHKDIYGETLRAEFNKMIRAEKKFPSLNALKNQISIDIASI